MSRSGYSDDGEYNLMNLWGNIVDRSIKGKRGQAFLRELAQAMDAMSAKRLIANDLVTETGEVCAIGVVCKARGLKTEDVDVYDRYAVGNLVNIAPTLAAEIEYHNDECGRHDETPEQRWARMRNWVDNQLVATTKEVP